MSYLNEYWRVKDTDGFPVHIYAGIRLLATVYDAESAKQMVELHNQTLAREMYKRSNQSDASEYDEKWLEALPYLLEDEIDCVAESVFENGKLAEVATTCALELNRDRSFSYIPALFDFYRQCGNVDTDKTDIYQAIFDGDVDVAPVILAALSGARNSWSPMSRKYANELRDAVLEAAPTWDWVKRAYDKDVAEHERNNFELAI